MKSYFKAILLASLFFGSVYGEEFSSTPVSNAFPYIDLGLGPLPIPCPIVGVGGRFQQGHLGLDLSLQLSTTVVLTAFKENIDLLFYPKPSLDSQFYLGMGGSSVQLLERKGYIQGFMSPQLLVGFEYNNDRDQRRYLQVRVDSPVMRQDWMSSHKYEGKKKRFLTSLIFSYGLCF